MIMELGGMIQGKATVLGGHCHFVHMDQIQISAVRGRQKTA